MGRYLMIKSWSNYRVAGFNRWIGWFRSPCCSRLFKFHSFEIIDFLVATCYWLVEDIYPVLTRLLWSLIENRCVKRGRNILVATTRPVSSWNIISDRLIRWLNRGIWQIWILSFPSDFNTFDIDYFFWNVCLFFFSVNTSNKTCMQNICAFIYFIYFNV